MRYNCRRWGDPAQSGKVNPETEKDRVQVRKGLVD
jgi:hypothetical protein